MSHRRSCKSARVLTLVGLRERLRTVWRRLHGALVMRVIDRIVVEVHVVISRLPNGRVRGPSKIVLHDALRAQAGSARTYAAADT